MEIVYYWTHAVVNSYMRGSWVNYERLPSQPMVYSTRHHWAIRVSLPLDCKDEMNKLVSEKTLVAKPRNSRSPARIVWSCLLIVLLLGGSVTYAWLRLQHSTGVTPQHAIQLPAIEPAGCDWDDHRG